MGEALGQSPGLRASGAAAAVSRRRALTKRTFDFAVASVLLVLLSLALLACAIAIKLDSRGPVFYRSRRVGQGGREFSMLKFRKMRNDASGLALTLARDDRFTRIGRFLAQSKLDELPQLWNVVRGQMSLVGPRPEDAEFVSMHGERYQQILEVKPGMTGLCQLAFAKEGAILDPGDPVGYYTERLLPQKVAIDELYATRTTLWMDLRILAWTTLAVFGRIDVAVNRGTGRLTRRRRQVRSVEPSVAEA